MRGRFSRPLQLLIGLVVPCAVLALAMTDSSGSAGPMLAGIRGEEVRVLTDVELLHAGSGMGGGLSLACQEVSTYTDANFSGGSYVVQAGFAEQEIAAVSFTIPANRFPIRIDSTEMIFATSNTIVTTTTHWSVLVWEGTPASGTLLYEFSSDGLILPHLVLPPGTNGANIFFTIDPNDPEQMIVNNNGSATFSVGYRIDKHNNQTQNPCTVAPPSNSNAFPTTDVGGLHNPANNWLYGVNCGPFGCPANGGWARFSQLPFYCQPSGDWVIRVTWTSIPCAPGVGACCKPDGSCDIMTQAECQQINGLYRGDDTNCFDANCPPPMGACCFDPSGCLNMTQANCNIAGGTWLGPGTACAPNNQCPTGACCLPDGSCVNGVTSLACTAQGGTFQGVGTNCGSVNCPQPTGACCLQSGGCLQLTNADCNVIPNSFWAGPNTLCPDACVQVECPGDVDGDLVVGQADLGILLASFAKCLGDSGYDPRADLDDDDCVGQGDLGIVLANFGDNCGP
ncbi:MAG: hypothetical protein LC135_12155 [Phycisphaerae bacterium]|nr:hypothetical protein [Phycisphaerae bacterium]MCZ2400603.1 hypothetical protein [Phycisphaerae bacterium]